MEVYNINFNAVIQSIFENLAASQERMEDLENDINNAMPKSGGQFTGLVKGTDGNLGGNIFRNIAVANSAGTWQATNYIIMLRK